MHQLPPQKNPIVSLQWPVILKFLYETFYKKWVLSRIVYSLPVQLLLLNIKKNQLLVILWIVLFGIITESIGTMLGLPFLFLEPEYIGTVSFWSTFIIGLTLGGFTMSFHITCYILDGHRFGFLGHVRHPFQKFSLNNSVIPIFFMVVYVVKFYYFQNHNTLEIKENIWIRIGGIMLGYLLISSFFFSYFFVTNRDIFHVMKRMNKNINKKLLRNRITRVNVMSRYNTARRNKIRVDYYFSSPFRYRQVDENTIIDRQAIFKIFDQNHFNSIIIQSTIFILVMILGYFEENPYFQIPAGASLVLLMTIFVMFAGAVTFWLKQWTITVLIIGLIAANALLKKEIFTQAFEAYGIDYDTPTRPEYSIRSVKELANDENFKTDYQNTIISLNNWREKFPKDKKPKMVFICASGGGQRAAAWTMRALQYADSSLGGQLMNHSMLMTGASGGLVGAAYFRELYLRQQMGENLNIYAKEYYENITRDNLNSVAFSWIVNDLFFRFQKFQYDGRTYYKDRGHALEEQLNHNTRGILDKPLSAYKEPEILGQIPTMVLSPTIINDGRKLYISAQHVSYLCTANIYHTRFLNQKIKGVEFLRLFENQDAENLRFLSALRMSATFPYVTPNVILPSVPEIQIMDAGLADNFGVEAAVRFLYVFKEWIQQNTSGVVFISVRDTQKNKPIEKNIEPSLFQRFTAPLGGVYVNVEYMQDIRNDDMIEYMQAYFKEPVKIHRIELEYVPISKNLQEIHEAMERKKDIDPNQIIIIERAVLSWHLTNKEKESIFRTIYELRNQSAIRQLDYLLNEEIK